MNLYNGIRSRLARLLCASICAFLVAGVSAQEDFPSKPIRMVVPFAPGGETDIFCRAIAQRLSEVLGQNIIVDNRAGATGIVGSEHVARSAPDGYTLIFGTAATHALNLAVFKTLPYHPVRDFEPVALLGSVPLVVFTHPSMPSNLKDFIAELKANPGKYSYGAAGSSTSHLGIELFKNAAGVNAVHVPYKGTGPALQDTVSGQVQFMGGSIGVGLPMLQTGRVRALGVMGRARMTSAPNVPTFAEAGMPNMEVGTWNVVMAPRGTPKPVVDRLNAAINKVLGEDPIRAKLDSYGITPIADSTPASTAAHIQREIARWGEAFRLSGAQQQ
ncbi:MAG TPA: tripartite tricarboxylate transporter substrate binding protein [Burkholderiaceae bacterium]|jgi:tripartite-type tricarboxylate transporter receptor subunit TctC|nr:tripartite tricarboxylate transporter substrate binding protein [Burkholderiaceae bacterium]